MDSDITPSCRKRRPHVSHKTCGTASGRKEKERVRVRGGSGCESESEGPIDESWEEEVRQGREAHEGWMS
jgi:hypothetical protein